jgi:hypothetical protein
MHKLEESKRSGTFTISSGKEVYGELTLAGAKSSLYLHDKEFFHTGIARDCITGVLHDLTKVTLINCITTSGTGSGSRGGERYHFANIFPHFVVFGDRFVNPAEKAIAEVRFVMEDATTLFYDFDAFGTVIDARPFIDQIAHANKLDREITTGAEPQILYFTGKREVFTVETALGRISATHNPGHTLPDPSGLFLRNTISVNIMFKDPVTFDEAIARTSTLLSYLGVLVGRPQNLVDLDVRVEPDAETSAPVRVYWSMPPERGPSEEGRRPHPSDVLLDPVRQRGQFTGVLSRWLDRQVEWRDARLGFWNSFAEQHRYGLDRLIGSANMFDILPSSAVPPDVPLTKELQDAKEVARKIFGLLPQSPERDSVLGALGRMGKSNLKQKIRHRAKWVIDSVGERFPDLTTVCDEAVNCRNYYVHGGEARFDYGGNFAATSFFTDTLEFVFAASDLIEAGWDVKRWITTPTTMSHPFASYRVNYSMNLLALKALLV